MRTHLMKTILLVLVFSFSLFLFASNITSFNNADNNIEAINSDPTIGNQTYEERAHYRVLGFKSKVNSRNTVDLTWEKPIPTDMWEEGFEGGRMPAGWTVKGVNTTEVGPNGAPGYWIIATGAKFGNYHAALPWDWEHQDEWMITPEFVCPPGALVFWTGLNIPLAHSRQNSCAVKLSNDGGNTWILLKDLAAMLFMPNEYDTPIVLELDNFIGQNIKLAWHGADGPANDGLSVNWLVDNISVGGMALRMEDMTIVSNGKEIPNPLRNIDVNSFTDRDPIPLSAYGDIQTYNNDDIDVTRDLEGYVLYRFQSINEDKPSEWYEVDILTDPDQLHYEDIDWPYLEDGKYKYAIKAMFDGGTLSQPSISNQILHAPVSEVTVKLTTNSKDSPVGALVKFADVYDRENIISAYAPANGIVKFSSIRYSAYRISVTNPGFNDFVIPEVDIETPQWGIDIELIENFQPVVDLKYNIIAGNSVELNWLEPGTLINKPQWISWCGQESVDAIGTGQAAQFTTASRFTPSDLAQLEVIGLDLTKIKFVPWETNASYTIQVWTGGSSNPFTPGTLVHSQAVTGIVQKQWNTVELNSPVPIPRDQELWIGYKVDTRGGYPAGTDNGPAINGKGNIIFMSNQWTTLIALNPTLTGNWSLKAYAGFPDSSGDVLLSDDGSRALNGYKILRNGAIIAQGVSATTYTDSRVPNGSYVYSVIAQYTTGESMAETTDSITILGVEDNLTIPQVTKLIGNYPNPFNPETTISFSLEAKGKVLVEVFNLKGQKIKTLLNKSAESGYHSITWDGKDDFNNEVGSGVFFYKLTTDSYSETRKMIMMK